jgi:hypothetical protein
VRRSLTTDASGGRELAFFTCHAPAGTTLAELVTVAGTRWAVEECFQAAKNETGLDHYQVRRYDAWYRHATLSMLALAFLLVTAAQKGAPAPVDNFPGHGSCMITTASSSDSPPARSPLVHDRRPAHSSEHYQQWSRWRRRHQARARAAHYKRRQHLNLRLQL